MPIYKEGISGTEEFQFIISGNYLWILRETLLNAFNNVFFLYSYAFAFMLNFVWDNIGKITWKLEIFCEFQWFTFNFFFANRLIKYLFYYFQISTTFMQLPTFSRKHSYMSKGFVLYSKLRNCPISFLTLGKLFWIFWNLFFELDAKNYQIFYRSEYKINHIFLKVFRE